MSPKKITRLRKKLGLSQARFAERLGVSRVTVSRWEIGERQPEKWNAHQLKQLEKESAA